MPDISQDNLLIEAMIKIAKADAEVASIITSVNNFIQAQQRGSSNTYPQLTFEVDLEAQLYGFAAFRGLARITGWHSDLPPSNATTLRTLMAGIRRLFSVEHNTSSINSEVSGLKLRHMYQLSSPLLVDNETNEIFIPAEFEVVIGV